MGAHNPRVPITSTVATSANDMRHNFVFFKLLSLTSLTITIKKHEMVTRMRTTYPGPNLVFGGGGVGLAQMEVCGVPVIEYLLTGNHKWYTLSSKMHS
jgi:hypothetical protein